MAIFWSDSLVALFDPKRRPVSCLGLQQRPLAFAALCGTVVLAGWVAAGLLGSGSPRIERTISATAGAEPIDPPQATAIGEDGVSVTDVALPEPRSMPPL